MAGPIIGALSCVLCGVPFFLIAYVGRISSKPIPFWSGDKRLDSIVKNVPEYNREMAAAYRLYGAQFLVTAGLMLFWPKVGTVCMVLVCSLSLYLLARKYHQILKKYS